MSITDELREYAEGCYGGSRTRLKKIADRIDAAHEKELAEQYASLTVNMEPMTEENMAKGGWVRLPKDAYGEYIHIGDEVDTEHFGTVEVVGFMRNAVTFYNYSGQPAYICMTPASLCHHHEPTVEDVMVEFATDWECTQDGEDKTAVLKEYAAKLRLADERE